MGLALRGWSFILPLALFTLAVSFTVWLVFRSIDLHMGQVIWGIISFHMLATLVLHAWQESAINGDPKAFVRRYFAGLVLKMFASFLVLLLLILTMPREEVLPAVLTFVLLYLVYLAFSTARTTNILRRP